MNVARSDEEVQLQSSVRRHLERNVAPHVNDAERERTFRWDLLPELYRFGYVRGCVPAQHGGDGMPYRMQAILMEEAGRCWGSLRTTVNVQSMVAVALSRHATEQQHREFLAPLLEGQRFGWFGITEPEAGSDAGAIQTVAEVDGDEFVVTGRKLYITNALGCDFGILLADVRDDDGPQGLTAMLVDRERSPYGAYDIPHLPVRATTSCELVFDQVRVPRSNQLGEVGRGLGVAMSAVNLGRLNMAMGAVGLSQACLDEVISFTTARHQFGRPLAGFQLVQDMVARIATLTMTSRLLGMHAATTLDAGEPGRFECSMAKYHCAESATEAASIALQAHGGAGLMEESPVERYFRDAREATIPEGTSQMQILHIAKHLLGVSALR